MNCKLRKFNLLLVNSILFGQDVSFKFQSHFVDTLYIVGYVFEYYCIKNNK